MVRLGFRDEEKKQNHGAQSLWGDWRMQCRSRRSQKGALVLRRVALSIPASQYVPTVTRAPFLKRSQ